MSKPDRVITRFDISPMTLRLTEPFSISAGAPVEARNVLVRACLQDGSVGYGEAAPFEAITGESQASTISVLRDVAATIVGRDAAAWRVLAADLRNSLSASPAARCATEQAVIDALVRHLHVPLSSFFGGSPRDLITDITVPAKDIRASVDSARRALDAGFQTIKVKIAASHWKADVARIVAISRAAPGLAIIVDGNAGYSFAQARNFLRGVAAAGIELALVEQPIAAENVAGLAELGEEFRVPMCADESVRSPSDALRVVEVGGISVINVKLMKSGVADALDIIAVARSAGLSGMIGGMIESAVSMTFSAAMAAAFHPFFAYIDLDTPYFMQSEFSDGGVVYSGPHIHVRPDVVGTGIDAARYWCEE